MKDYYKILGVSVDATQAEIKRAYREAVFRWHPDRNPSPEAHDKMVLINEAYDILSNEVSRQMYDYQRREPVRPAQHSQPKSTYNPPPYSPPPAADDRKYGWPANTWRVLLFVFILFRLLMNLNCNNSNKKISIPFIPRPKISEAQQYKNKFAVNIDSIIDHIDFTRPVSKNKPDIKCPFIIFTEIDSSIEFEINYNKSISICDPAYKECNTIVVISQQFSVTKLYFLTAKNLDIAKVIVLPRNELYPFEKPFGQPSKRIIEKIETEFR